MGRGRVAGQVHERMEAEGMKTIKDRVFVQHIPGCVEADPYVIRYSTWKDLESKVRHWGRIGCDSASEYSVTLVDIF